MAVRKPLVCVGGRVMQLPEEDRLGAVAPAAIASYTYADRANLRSNTTDTHAVVDGLGLFEHTPGSTEPDDDESCFATATGRWLLQAVHWDLVDAYVQPEIDACVQVAIDAATKRLYGSATCSITSVAATASASFIGNVPGAAVGDSVVATPPAQLGSTAAHTGRLSYHAWVSAADTVTVTLTNASAASATTNIAVQTAWPITVFKV